MLITLLSFFFVLSILVIVHEFGHYAVAKLGGIGVERFSIGYPPRLVGVKIGETDYCISAIPFGGYVKLHGQDDFASPDEYTGDSRDYRSKHPILKIAVLVSGSLMNLLTAVVIFAVLFIIYGTPEPTSTVGFVKNGTMASEIGLKLNDTVISVDGSKIDDLDEILLPMFMNDTVSIEVMRDGSSMVLTTTRKLGQNEEFGAAPQIKAQIGTVVTGLPAAEAGMKPGDIITELDGIAVNGWYHMSNLIRERPELQTVVTVERNEELLSLPIKIGTAEEELPDGSFITIGKIGITQKLETQPVGVIKGTVMAFRNTGYLITYMLDFFGKLVTGQMSTKLLGGPVMIAQMAGESARSGFSTLLNFTAFISINLGVLNLLPFPVLDGGHVFILFIEMITRRQVSERLKIALQQTGSLILLLLMLYITFNDIMRFDSISRLFGG